MALRLLFTIILYYILLPEVYSQPLWGYYYNNSLPYKNNQHYWEKRLGNLTVLCFTGITINNTGCTIPQFTHEQTLFKKAHQHGITLIPHVTFTNVKSGIAFLTHPQYWENTIRILVHAIHTNSWAGCHFDFEYIPSQYAPKLSQFLKTFKATAPDISLSMAMFPQVEFDPTVASFHNFTLLSPHLDAIVLMCYDYHNPKTKPGPVTSIAWAEKNIDYALKFFMSQQIWLGIPAYGYMWKNDTFYSAIPMKLLSKYLYSYRHYRHYSGTIMIDYIQHNNHFVAYIPDTTTHNQLQQIAQKYNIKGIAIWRLGFE